MQYQASYMAVYTEHFLHRWRGDFGQQSYSSTKSCWKYHRRSMWTTSKENENKKGTYSNRQKETVIISETHNEKRGLGEFDAHRIYWRKAWLEKSNKKTPQRANLNGWQGTRSDSKKMNMQRTWKWVAPNEKNVVHAHESYIIRTISSRFYMEIKSIRNVLIITNKISFLSRLLFDEIKMIRYIRFLKNLLFVKIFFLLQLNLKRWCNCHYISKASGLFIDREISDYQKEGRCILCHLSNNKARVNIAAVVMIQETGLKQRKELKEAIKREIFKVLSSSIFSWFKLTSRILSKNFK